MTPELLGGAREGAGRVRQAGAGPRACRSRRAIRGSRTCWSGRSAAAKISSEARSSRRSATTRPATRSTRSRQSRSSMARLQDDAALALGKIGDKRALEMLAGLQRTAPRATQPPLRQRSACSASTAIRTKLPESRRSKFADANPGFQELLRGSAGGLGALGVAGDEQATATLFEVGIPSRDPTRAPVALARGDDRAPQHAADADRFSKNRGSGRRSRAEAIALCSPKGSTCSKRISTRSASSRWSGAPTGQSAEGSTDPRSDADAHRPAGLSEMDYRQSGVDIDAGNETVRRIKSLAQADVHAGRPLGDRIVRRPVSSSTATAYDEPVLVSSADGVGTKLKVAFMTGRHDTVGARSRQPLRQRHPRAGRPAAVLPRLPGDRAAVA